jgi:hypothetical protein
MRAHRRFSLAVLAVLLAAASCGPARHAGSAGAAADGAATVAPAARRHAPPPADPDLGTVVERFYQYVEGAHWRFAYAMLSPRYRGTLTEQDLMQHYGSIGSGDVAVRQTPGTVVTAVLDASDPKDPSRHVRVEEKLKLVWDGEQWMIDDIARRGVSPGTR